jgi:hypothetical protein
VLRLKVLNLLLALLPMHSVFLGGAERLDKHCAPKIESLKEWITTVTAGGPAQTDRSKRGAAAGLMSPPQIPAQGSLS